MLRASTDFLSYNDLIGSFEEADRCSGARWVNSRCGDGAWSHLYDVAQGDRHSGSLKALIEETRLD